MERHTPDERGKGAELRERARRGLASRAAAYPGAVDVERRRRLESELRTIERLRLTSLCLLAHDAVLLARDAGAVVGPGRGTAPGSVVCWALGITHVDPVSHGLHFERMVNPLRPSLSPSIDIDVEAQKVDVVVRAVLSRHRHQVTLVPPAGGAARAALKSAAWELAVPTSRLERVRELIPEDVATMRDAVVSTPGIGALMAGGLTKRWLTRALQLDQSVPQWHPFLPLIALGTPGSDDAGSTLRDAVERGGRGAVGFGAVPELSGLSEQDWALPSERGRAYRLLAEGRVRGVPHLDSPGLRTFLMELRPATFEMLMAAIALSRPAAKEQGYLDELLRRKRRPRARTVPHESLRPVLAATHGLLVYQEQVADVVRSFAGLDLAHAHLFRRDLALSKPDAVARMRERFLRGARRLGRSRKSAHVVFDWLLQHGSYPVLRADHVGAAMLTMATAARAAREAFGRG